MKELFRKVPNKDIFEKEERNFVMREIGYVFIIFNIIFFEIEIKRSEGKDGRKILKIAQNIACNLPVQRNHFKKHIKKSNQIKKRFLLL